MRWIKVEFKRAGVLFQDISASGVVLQYTDKDGVLIFETPPKGDSCRVIDSNPADAPPRATPYDLSRYGDRRRKSRRLTDV